jgi:iron complex transport system ATP-binding protein
MRTLAAMQDPLGGQIMLEGQNIARLNARQLARRLSVVLTDRPNLGLLSGWGLVALGRHPHTGWGGRLSRHDEAVIRWAVEAVGAADLAEKPVMELSDGQRQKLMIARALAQESAIILLDEPTAFLDLPRRVEMMQLLRHLAAETGRAILLSTHDLDLALRSADHLWLMAEGRVQCGAPEDLVISGAFERAFADEGVVFDRSSGAFRIQANSRYEVALHGSGLPHTWTRRALERDGFRLSANARLRVEVLSQDEDAPRWRLEGAAPQPLMADSIAELLATLHQQIRAD